MEDRDDFGAAEDDGFDEGFEVTHGAVNAIPDAFLDGATGLDVWSGFGTSELCWTTVEVSLFSTPFPTGTGFGTGRGTLRAFLPFNFNFGIAFSSGRRLEDLSETSPVDGGRCPRSSDKINGEDGTENAITASVVLASIF